MTPRWTRQTQTLLFAGLLACKGDDYPDGRAFGPEVTATARYDAVVPAPTTLGVVDTSRRDALGRPIGVACVTCHGPTPDTSWAAGEGAPEAFHGKVELTHGDLSCNACHDPVDRTALHLADGTRLEMGDVKSLCAQCHGVQHRDWLAGAHGGMSGFWDLRRGPRVRNLCVTCHAAHRPAIPQTQPVHPPADPIVAKASPLRASGLAPTRAPVDTPHAASSPYPAEHQSEAVVPPFRDRGLPHHDEEHAP